MRLANQIGGQLLKLVRVDCAPVPLQLQRTVVDPYVSRDLVSHDAIILYIYTVICDVYILYESGNPLPEEVVRAQPARGWLCYGNAGRSSPHDEAHLYRSRTDPAEVIPFVDYARVKKIKRGGLRIEGMQRHGYNDHWKHVWWCLPAREEKPDAPTERPT